MTAAAAGSAAIANIPMPTSQWVDANGRPTPQFFQAFTAVWQRTGGVSAPTTAGVSGISALVNDIGAVQDLALEAQSIAALALLDNPDSLATTGEVLGADDTAQALALFGDLGGTGSGGGGTGTQSLYFSFADVGSDLLGYDPPAGAIAGGAVVLIVVVQNLILPANLSGSLGFALSAPTASAAFTLAYIRAGVTTAIATLTFAAGSHVLTAPTSSALMLVPGDVLTLTAQATPNSTLATVGITLLAQQV